MAFLFIYLFFEDKVDDINDDDKNDNNDLWYLSLKANYLNLN